MHNRFHTKNQQRLFTKYLQLQEKNISVIHPMELLDYSIGGVKLEVQKTKISVTANIILAGQ
ncbi:hypothetical protein H6H03_30070 [Nostoc paludosum FACHB-159]|uniref:PilZ domain-containing protein n=1 Tax=Nostoc paludosum FACHB-159 TaxID=2692908 RepID=A0ABR8KGA2_9NOSO|nr:hypothetical protein [Nostoc paludosum FACHB-159]